jgi:uncharacterized membrane protein
MIDLFELMILLILMVFVIAGLLVFFASSIPKKYPTATLVFSIVLVILCVAVDIHIQIPDQEYCNDIQEHNYGFGRVMYLESLTKYDYSLGESKCILTGDGNFIANPNYSIWGIRI